MKKICPLCGTENEEESRFCKECNEPLYNTTNNNKIKEIYRKKHMEEMDKIRTEARAKAEKEDKKLVKDPWQIIRISFFILLLVSVIIVGMIEEDNRIGGIIIIMIFAGGVPVENYIEKQRQKYWEREELYNKHLPKVRCPKCGKVYDWKYEYEGYFCDCGEKLMMENEKDEKDEEDEEDDEEEE